MWGGGGHISPLLFNLCLNELPFLLDNNERSYSLILRDGTKLNSLLYVDGLIILSRSKHGLLTKLPKHITIIL